MKTLYVFALLMALFMVSAQAQTAPTIVSLTQSQRLIQGQSLSLTVSVNGTTPFTYQWNKAGAPITGATTNIYTIAALAVTDAGSYTVTVTNTAGSVTSGEILIDVTPATAPTFYYQPSNVTYFVGDTINLYASVNGTSPLTFVWKKAGTTVATTDNYSYSKANAQTSDSGSYTVTVSNIAGSVTSAAFTVTVNPMTAPVFTQAPYNETVSAGGYFSFWASVSNSNGVTFQWYKDRTAIAGATSYYFSVWSAQAADAGSYTVVATNSAGSTTSVAGVVTVLAAVAPSNVSITNGPITVAVGGSFSLDGWASGTSPFTYQWRKDGANISGATSSSYGKSSATANDAGTYTLVVTNSVGSATSAGTSVSITSALGPVIVSNPGSRTAYPGDYVSLSVSATGTGSLGYQWKKDGVIITGATSSYYYVSSSVAASDSGSYTVVVSNTQGSVTSQPAILTVLAPVAPTIQSQPANVSIPAGQAINLSVGASGKPAPSYQWKKDGAIISGATSYSYYKGNAASSDSGSYTVVVTNAAGSVTSQAATVTVSVAVAPVITLHPASASLLPGDSFYGLSVGYSSGSAPTVEWFHDGVSLGSGSASFYISNAQPTHAGAYTAKVTNSAGSVTSDEGVITVDLSSARPVIIYTSGSQAVAVGNYFGLSINVSPATTSYTVAWKKDGVVVPNANSLSLGFSNFSRALAGSYTAEVTTSAGTFVSREIALSVLNDGVSPHITTDPASLARYPGDSASFSVQVDGGETPFTYQWRKDGVDIPSGIYSSYNFTVAAASAGDYVVVVTNRNGSVTSGVATLTVTPNSAVGVPIISYQPVSQTLTAGHSSLSLGVQVLNNTSGQTYQWYKDGVAISGATGSSYYSPSYVAVADAGRYKVVVTNSAGSTTSDEAVIAVISPATGPIFTIQPRSQTAYAGDSVSFTASASGNSAVSYQWRKDGTAIAGATDSTLALTNLQRSDAGNYTVVATDADGSTSSSIATLTIQAGVAPTITSQPVPVVGALGGTASFSVAASGTPDPDYQWMKDGSEIPGATHATLRLTNLRASDAGAYSVVVSNSAGSVTSRDATLTIPTTGTPPASAPVFTTQPQSQAYAPGEMASLSVVVTGVPTPTLQWYKNGAAIGGATSATLSLGKMTPELVAQYFVVATNSTAAVTSATATLSLKFVGTYFGTLSTGESWALTVNDDGSAVFLGMLSASGQIVFDDSVVLTATGDFSFGQGSTATSSPARASRAIGVRTADPLASFYFTGLVTGNISGGTVTGQIAGNGTTLSGQEITASTSAATFAGYYEAIPLGTGLGEIHALVAPNGSILLIAVDATGVRGGVGTVSATGTFTITQSQFSYSGKLLSTTGSISGTYQPAGGTAVVIAPPPSAGGVMGRLVNVSARGVAGSGSDTFMAGFVIAPGSVLKGVLVRAVGPTLATMNVSGALANPQLVLYKGSTPILDNDDWSASGNATEIAAAAARLGAFPLPAGSADAAILTQVASGLYSTHITTAGATGVALLEVYDASAPGDGAPNIINLSARDNVGLGDNILIVGFVIDGTAPKKVLIRAVGPALASQGVTGVLVDPKLRLFHGGTVLTENDNWSAGADGPTLAAAAQTVGAQPLPNGSKDAALLVYLAPGLYSAQVSGVGDTTGVALVEVYDVP